MAADSLNRHFVYANRDVMLPDYGAGETTEQQAPLLPGERPYGARSEESVVVGDLLMQHVPALARGDLEIVARQALGVQIIGKLLAQIGSESFSGKRIRGQPS